MQQRLARWSDWKQIQWSLLGWGDFIVLPQKFPDGWKLACMLFAQTLKWLFPLHIWPCDERCVWYSAGWYLSWREELWFCTTGRTCGQFFFLCCTQPDSVWLISKLNPRCRTWVVTPLVMFHNGRLMPVFCKPDIVFVFVYLTGCPQTLALNSHIGVSFPKDATPEMLPSFMPSMMKARRWGWSKTMWIMITYCKYMKTIHLTKSVV